MQPPSTRTRQTLRPCRRDDSSGDSILQITRWVIPFVAILFLVLPATAIASPNEEDMPTIPHEPDKGETREENAPSAFKMDAERWRYVGFGSVGAAFVIYAVRSFWWPPIRFLAATLFARLTRREIETHPTRARILESVAQQPGIAVAELAAQHELNIGTLDYHVAVLRRDGQLRTTKAGRNRLLFLPNAGVDVAHVGEVSASGRNDVARAILSEPGLHAAALAQKVGLSPATVHHHLTRLEAAGLVRIERGLRARCYPTERLPEALEPARRRRMAILAPPTGRGH